MESGKDRHGETASELVAGHGSRRATKRRVRLTDGGRQFVGTAVVDWAAADELSTSTNDGLGAGTYETTVHARAVDPEFRATVFSQYGRTCPFSGVDHPGLLDVAHVLSWRDYPEYRAALANVLAFSKTHHAAFGRGLCTIDRDYRLHVTPSFETESDVLQRTIIERAGERVPLPAESVKPEYVAQHNAELEWV